MQKQITLPGAKVMELADPQPGQFCSFCGKGPDERGPLVAGKFNGVHVCSHCVAMLGGFWETMRLPFEEREKRMAAASKEVVRIVEGYRLSEGDSFIVLFTAGVALSNRK